MSFGRPERILIKEAKTSKGGTLSHADRRSPGHAVAERLLLSSLLPKLAGLKDDQVPEATALS